MSRFIILCLGLWLAWSPPAQAQSALGGSKGPIQIDADALDVHQDKQIAIFSGNVVAVQGTTTIKSDRMTVFYRNSDQAKQGAQRISKIDVDGNVTLTSPEETAKGKKGIYYVDQKMVRLFGDVVLTQGKNILKGDGLEYNMATGRSRVVSQAAAIDAQGAQGVSATGGRVRGLFIPDGE